MILTNIIFSNLKKPLPLVLKSSGKLFWLTCLTGIIAISQTGCNTAPGNKIISADSMPAIEPDYSMITVPPNIAPLNFKINEEGTAFYAYFSSGESSGFGVSSKDGSIIIPSDKWERMLQANIGGQYVVELYSKGNDGKWIKYQSIKNTIAKEETDPYLYYRLLYPGYESWSELSINYRALDSFKEKALIENRVADENCINCHSFNNGKSDDFLFHMRGSHGGTYFHSKGSFRKVNLINEK